jgi:Tol biopolymer transport system component
MARDGDGGIPEDGEPTYLGIGAGAEPPLSPSSPAALSTELSGREISHFRVGEPLGSGGMGVVFEAEDTRLGRTVALKFLAPELVRDPVAKNRFLTEARAASALDHPNLCTILEAGESEDGLLFLAMPRYDGESLQRLISRGPLPVEQAVEIAAQAARGLAKAHEHGIVHRDVKPGNLFVTRDGVVKILDFGIAKLSGEAATTRAGAVLGTPAYMAPEQSLGETIDARADVWSLGAVLYEMLAGRRPFTGATVVAVVYSSIHEAPEPLVNLRPEAPAELDRIVSRMLAKDPEQRYANAAEILDDLRTSLGLPTTGTLSYPAAGPTRRRIPRAALAGLALAILAIAAVALLLWRYDRAEATPQPEQSVQLTDFQGRETSPSLSPDGTVVVYARSVEGNFDIFWQRVEDGQPMNLTKGSTADDTQPAFSPDGQKIAFRSERDGGGIFLMGATGESVRRLTDFGFNPAWSPDGREIAVATEGAFDPTARLSRSRILRIDVATGASRPLPLPDGVQPSWSPDGSRIAFWGVTKPEYRRGIWTISVGGGGAPVPVVHDAFYNWSPVWSPDGRFLYFASDRGGSMNLWRVAVDERSGSVLGDPQPITTPSEWSALPSFSRDGRRLVYATSSSRSFVEQVPLDPETGRADGPPVLVHQGARAVRSCDVSPDGGWLVLRVSAPTDDLLLIRPDGSDSRQLTDDLARDRMPRWSPDGGRILFASNRSGKYEAWTIRPDGGGLTQVTHLPDQQVVLPFWSPNGKRIAFTYGPHGTVLLDLSGPHSRTRVLPPAQNGQVLSGLSWSGDGQFLSGMLKSRDGVTTDGVIVWSLADNTFRRLTSKGEDPMFFREGTRIFFLTAGTIRLVDVAGGEVRTLLSPPPHSMYVSAGAGPGDRNLCTVRATVEGDIWSLSLNGPAGAILKD